MKIELDLPEIEGFEYTGEYRHATKGEMVCCAFSSQPFKVSSGKTEAHFLILKKKAPEYKTITRGDFLELSGHIDLREKFVEIKALEDAIRIIDRMESNPNESVECLAFGNVYESLQELIK